MNLIQALLNKSPVKITGVKQTASKRFHKQEQEFTIAKHAKVTPTSLHCTIPLMNTSATSYAPLLKHWKKMYMKL